MGTLEVQVDAAELQGDTQARLRAQYAGDGLGTGDPDSEGGWSKLLVRGLHGSH